MKQKDEQRKTIFRRIGGRIVPISIGVGSIGAGSRITPGLLYKAEDVAIRKAHTVLEAKKFKAAGTQYAGDKAARFSHLARIKFKDAIANVGLNPYKINFSAGYSARTFFNKGEIQVSGKDLPGFFHELGHAQQYQKKTVSVRMGKAIQSINIPLLSITDLNNMGSKNPLKKGAAYLKEHLIGRAAQTKSYAAEVNRLAQEAGA